MGRFWTLGVLALSVGLAGCNACSRKKVEDEKPVETDKGKAKAKAKAEPEIPPKDTITTLVFPDAERLGSILIWMESRNGMITAKPGESWWTDQGPVHKVQGGYVHTLVNANQYRTTTPPEDGELMSDVLDRATDPPPGYTLEVNSSSGGREVITVKPPIGKSHRLGRFPVTPEPMIWLEAEKPAQIGKPFQPAPTGAFVKNDDGSGYKDVIPNGSSALDAEVMAGDALAPYKADIEKMFKSGVEIVYAAEVDIDDDGATEGFFCIPGGRIEAGICLIADDVDGELRYYTGNMNVSSKGPKPRFFSTNGASYAMLAGDKATVIRFDGSGYTTTTIQ